VGAKPVAPAAPPQAAVEADSAEPSAPVRAVKYMSPSVIANQLVTLKASADSFHRNTRECLYRNWNPKRSIHTLT
jgi:hypothetical protein